MFTGGEYNKTPMDKGVQKIHYLLKNMSLIQLNSCSARFNLVGVVLGYREAILLYGMSELDCELMIIKDE